MSHWLHAKTLHLNCVHSGADKYMVNIDSIYRVRQKVNPLMFFAVLLAIVWDFNVKL